MSAEQIKKRLGVIRRHAFVAAAAAEKNCVRAALLTHEAAHNRALNAAVGAFLAQHRLASTAAVGRLGACRAPTPTTAKQAFQDELKRVLAELMLIF